MTTYVHQEELGRHLYTWNKKIILRKTQKPLIQIKFEDDQLARRIALRIRNLYGNDLDYLFEAKWLIGISQIHQAIRERFIMGDVLNLLEEKDRTITEEDFIKCENEVTQSYLTKFETD